MIRTLVWLAATVADRGTPPDPTGPLEPYEDGGLLDASLNDIAGAIGGDANYAALVVGLVFVSLYVAGKRDFATPAILLMVVGGIAIPLLPGGYRKIAGTVVILGFATGLLAVGRRYVLSPGATR